MRSARVAVLGAVALAGLAGLAVAAVTDERDPAFTLGVRPTMVAGVVLPGQTACQAPIDVPTEVDEVRFQVGTFGRPGPPLVVRFPSTGGGRPIAATRVAGGYPDVSIVRAPARLEDGMRIGVCIQNRGSRRVALYGGPAQAARTSALKVEGRPTGTDMTLTFSLKQPRSAASLLPEIVDRAAVFKADWVTSGVIWALLAVLSLGVPALLALAVSRADDAGG